MSAPIRRQVLPLLLNLVSHTEDTSRSAASGCLGAFCKWIPDEDLINVMDEVLFNSSGKIIFFVFIYKCKLTRVTFKKPIERSVIFLKTSTKNILKI